MRRLESSRELRAQLESHRDDGLGPFYLQRFVKHPGRDLGVAVLDGRCIGAYWRVAAADHWMTTILSGGRYEKADLDPDTEAIAVRAARHFGLVFTGVDLIEDSDGRFNVLEVSAFGGFRGLLNGCGIDAAPMLADLVLRRDRSGSPDESPVADRGRTGAPQLSLFFADVPVRVRTNDPEIRSASRRTSGRIVIGDDTAPLAESEPHPGPGADRRRIR